MAIDRRHVGYTFPPFAVTAECVRVERFAEAVGSRLHCRARLVERTPDQARLALEALIAGSDTVAISGSARIALGAH